MTFGYYTVTAGSTIHEHSHENDEVWNVIEGELEVTVDGEGHDVGVWHGVKSPHLLGRGGGAICAIPTLQINGASQGPRRFRRF